MSVFADTVFVYLLVLPMLIIAIPRCVKFGYLGLWRGEIPGHLGMRRGLLARLYGVFCLAITLLLLAGLLVLVGEMLTWNVGAVIAAFGERVLVQQDLALMFGGLGIFAVVLFYLVFQRRVKHDPEFANNLARQRAASFYLFGQGILIILFGVYFWLGVPLIIALLTWWIIVFVAATPANYRALLS
jgi:hypothetical protein